MKIYEVNYDKVMPIYGTCNCSAYVKANNEQEALTIAKQLITDNCSEIEVISEIVTLN